MEKKFSKPKKKNNCPPKLQWIEKYKICFKNPWVRKDARGIWNIHSKRYIQMALKEIERSSITFIIKDAQIKTILRYHSTLLD